MDWLEMVPIAALLTGIFAFVVGFWQMTIFAIIIIDRKYGKDVADIILTSVVVIIFLGIINYI